MPVSNRLAQNSEIRFSPSRNPHSVRPLPRQEDAEAKFRDDYAYFQYHLVEFVTEHLIDLSQTFKGDLQQVLILAMIGQMMLNRGNPAWNESGEVGKGITASRLADVTKIPRQTVRRKLEDLQACGWIEQTSDRMWRLAVKDGAVKAAQDLAAVDANGIRRGTKLALAFLQRL